MNCWRKINLKTSYGKLAVLAFVLLLAALLFAPMRAGREDELLLRPAALKMSVGGSYKVSCSLSSDEPNQTLRYSVENPGVATIDSDGTVRALAPGETAITARASGGAKAELQVLVDGTPLTELSLNVDEIHIDKGQFSGLRVSYNSDASDARLQWISGDERIARVDAAGRIEGVGGGETYVSVISPSGKSASAKVYVNVDATAAYISPNRLTLGVGAEVPLRVSYLPEDATDRVARWFSSDTAVLTVSGEGVLEARGEGSAYVSVLTEDGVTAGMEVKVEAAPKDLQLDPAEATIERGDAMDMQLKFLNKDGSVREGVDHLVVWSSSDERIATVDQNGRVTGVSSGSCTITAVSDGITAKCRLNVQVSIREIRLNHTEMYLLKEETGDPIQLEWIVSPADPDDAHVTFSTNNSQVANVTEDGLVTLTGGYGTAVITASSGSGASAGFTVHVVTELPEEDIIRENLVIEAEEIPAGEAVPEEKNSEENIPEEPAATGAPAQAQPAAVG